MRQKRSSIAEHMINNYDLSRFKVLKNCNNSIYLFRLGAISIFEGKVHGGKTSTSQHFLVDDLLLPCNPKDATKAS